MLQFDYRVIRFTKYAPQINQISNKLNYDLMTVITAA